MPANLIADSSFEAGDAGFTAYDGNSVHTRVTFTREAPAAQPDGLYGVRAARNTGPTAHTGVSRAFGGLFNFDGDLNWSAYVRGQAGTNGTIFVDWSGPGYLSTSTTFVFTGAWQRVSVAFTIPTAYHLGSVYVWRQSGAVGDLIDVDNVMLARGLELRPYDRLEDVGDPIGVEVGLPYVIVGPDGTRAVLNDRSDPDFVGFLSGEDGVTGLERAGIRESSDLLPEADGGVHGAFRYDRLSFTLKGVLPPGGVVALEAEDALTLEDRNVVPNPSFELDTAGWTAYQNGGTGTLARSTAVPAASGGAVAMLTATSAISNLGVVASYPGGIVVPTVPGELWNASAHFRAAGALRTVGMLVAFWNAGGAFITALGGGNIAEVAGQWVRPNYTATAPALAAFVGIYAQVFSLANGEVHYVDAIQLVKDTGAHGYFDGSTDPRGYPLRTQWEGTPHLSASSRYLVTQGARSEVREWVTRQARLMRATDAMRADARLLWTPSEAPPVQVSFRQQQPTRITGRRPKSFIVAGVSERNVIEAQDVSSVLLDLGAIVEGGFASPLRSLLASSSSVLGSAAAIVAGSSEAWPLITITGPIVNPSVISNTLGVGLYLNYTLAAGETLVLDSDPRRRTISLNGDANRYSALDYAASSWFPLLPGSNDLRLGAFSYSAGATVLVEWRDAWG